MVLWCLGKEKLNLDSSNVRPHLSTVILTLQDATNSAFPELSLERCLHLNFTTFRNYFYKVITKISREKNLHIVMLVKLNGANLLRKKDEQI